MSTTTASGINNKENRSSLTPTRFTRKPLITPSLSSSSMTSQQSSVASNVSSISSESQPIYISTPSYSTSHEQVTITNLTSLPSVPNRTLTSAKAYQAQASTALPSYYATVTPTSVNSSTGTATAVLSCSANIAQFNGTNACSYYIEEKETPNYQIEQLEFKNTVGTGTFGRVICVRHKQTKEYYALKIMSIAEVLRLKQTEHVKNEKEILNLVSHPFIINLYWTCHNEKFLYMLLEYVCGGELFSYLRNAVKFSNDTANFYAAEIISAIEYLHSLSIIYRDLKPENLLLDREGHIRICDFGFAKKVYDRTWTLCGTPEYLAPEIIQGKGHHKAVDWWALGILIYEMLAGYPPFYDENPFQIYQKILGGKIEWPRYLDSVAKDLIKKLLINDRTKRLGTMKNGAEDIKRHKWFKNIEWEMVAQRKLVPPIIPKVNHDGDTSRFDRYEEDGWKEVPTVSPKNQEAFQDF